MTTHKLLLGIVVASTLALGTWAAADPASLVVFPESLPKLANVYDAESSPVIRLDKMPNPPQPGIVLTKASDSPTNAPQAAMLYDTGGGETLLITVLDDAAVMAPATRMGQERLSQPAGPGSSMMNSFPAPQKISVKPASSPSVSLDGYLTRRDPGEPLLVMVIPDGKTGADRFVVNFSWLGSRSDRAEIVAAWLRQAAAKIDVAKLHALP